MECGICLSFYTGNKLPYGGPCGHSFCLECWLKTSQINYYICPLCKTTVPLSEVKKNYLAIEFLEKNSMLTISGLLNEYREFNENFEKRVEENIKLKDNIIELKQERKDILEHYKKEAYESIVNVAERKSNKIMEKTMEYSEDIISETEELILKMFLDIDEYLKKMRDKLEVYRNIDINDLD
jgi:hypothetical protein